jgi:hypothetical protein
MFAVRMTFIAHGGIGGTSRFFAVSSVPFVGVPSDPFSMWPEADRKRILYSKFERCADVCAGALGRTRQLACNFKSTKDFVSAGAPCMRRYLRRQHLPPDYPSKVKLQQAAIEKYTAAKDFGSELPPPTFPR